MKASLQPKPMYCSSDYYYSSYTSLLWFMTDKYLQQLKIYLQLLNGKMLICFAYFVYNTTSGFQIVSIGTRMCLMLPYFLGFHVNCTSFHIYKCEVNRTFSVEVILIFYTTQCKLITIIVLHAHFWEWELLTINSCLIRMTIFTVHWMVVKS